MFLSFRSSLPEIQVWKKASELLLTKTRSLLVSSPAALAETPVVESSGGHAFPGNTDVEIWLLDVW